MRSIQIFAAIAAALLVAAFPGSGSAGVPDLWGRAVPKACTPEAQRCLEKLEARMLLMGRNLDGVSIDQALLELHETDPVCALLLEGRLRDL
jgi:type 1 fimbria pilin